MTRDGIKKCIRLVQLSFPNTYKNFSMEDLQMLMEVWNVQFKNCDDLPVFSALNEVISTSEYPPTFADIKKAMLGNEYENEEELWALLLDAGRNGIYGADEEWERLPEKLKRITTPGTIKEIALSDNESLQYIKRDVLRDYRNYKETEFNKQLATSYTDTKLLN